MRRIAVHPVGAQVLGERPVVEAPEEVDVTAAELAPVVAVPERVEIVAQLKL